MPFKFSYCPNKARGCEWKGEVGGVEQHIAVCPKRPWKCQYCDYVSTSEEHVMNYTHYSTACPNQCDVGTIPQCQVEEHLTVCPLEVVECEFSDTGCSVRITHMDLQRHMDELQQQHLLSATVLNLKKQLLKRTTNLPRKIANLQRKTSKLLCFRNS